MIITSFVRNMRTCLCLLSEVLLRICYSGGRVIFTCWLGKRLRLWLIV
uniref:Uncharacterized protein n=1 Tax=Picea glauca TaxID=3330 RepID=A0A101LYQ5_PICGL|nr:hypothetical protein ABT39_MTgene4794 [Picea glauca]